MGRGTVARVRELEIQGEPQGSGHSFSAPDTELFAWSVLARSGGASAVGEETARGEEVKVLNSPCCSSSWPNPSMDPDS